MQAECLEAEEQPSYLNGRAEGSDPGNAAEAAQELGNLVLQGPKLRGLWPQDHLGTQCLDLLAEVFPSCPELSDDRGLARAKRHVLAHAAHLQRSEKVACLSKAFAQQQIQ